jgi:Protein of unknown function (DUF1592)/Protein of unknown function (DUF1588)/Protein of unknown function (DUF1587)/Protein of unknown function (DUF1585)/Protein of unknown function (DUF1595)/Cytochrome C oxidase, cbb3-type, subunit III
LSETEIVNARMTNRSSVRWMVLAVLALALPAMARADVFHDRVEAFTNKYCLSCHNSKQHKGDLDLSRYGRDQDVAGDFRRWHEVIEFVRKGQMPPAGKPQPTLEERDALVNGIEAILLVEAKKQAGDPGFVPPRRLSNTEYDLSVRDLTGVTIRATAEFPVDPAGGEGFDNTGEALGMTPTLLNKYLGAAQFVSDHLVLKTGGIAFAPFPVTSYNERKKLTEQAILDFYKSHTVRLADYLEAAWRYRHRGDAERGMSLETWAERNKLSAQYLALVSRTLDGAKTGTAYLKQLGLKWEALPAPKNAIEVPQEMRELERFLAVAQKQLCQREPELIVANAGCWPIGHLGLRAQVAANRDKFDPTNLKARQLFKLGKLQTKKGVKPAETTYWLRVDLAFEDSPAGTVVVSRSVFTKSDNLLPSKNKKEIENQGQESLRAVLEREAPEVAKRLAFGKHPDGGDLDPDAFALKGPGVLEIPLPAAAMAALQGKQLLVECELDPKGPSESAFHVQAAVGKRPEAKSGAGIELLIRPESKTAKEFVSSGERFCAAFPNRYFYVNDNRGLAAGFHLVEGFFRDDQPLVQKVLTGAERDELDHLWRELDFVTQSYETLLRGFVWFERSERHVLTDKRFDFLREDDPLLVEDPLLSKFERIYLGKLSVKLVDGEMKPEQPDTTFNLVHGFFQRVRTGLAVRKETMQRAEELALGDLETLAQRAYCRPLRPDEAASLRRLYERLRKQGQGEEEALRGTFAAVLMSPHFFYRIPMAKAGAGSQPLADDALARRLSYFLWSSLPDDELLKAAESGKLQDEQVLRTQVRRMMRDPKVESFAREFFGQWLRYRDFLGTDPIPAGTFPGYDATLRQAMFEEPTRLITHLIREDQKVDELLHSDATFVNEPLAKYYGGAIEAQFRKQRAADPKADWFRVEGMQSIGRGGVFGMPVILSKNSAGQRTSPVKRGFWVVHHLLGQHFPPPPADVPALPKSEKESAKTIREMLAQHTQQQQCAMCHVHFDGLGLTMEGFDATGRARTKDLAGRTIQAIGPLPGGKNADGVSGLIEYVEKNRMQEFERNLCRKVLGYALGRSVLLSDQPLVEEMEQKLHAERRFSVLFEAVVTSPQFRRQRGRDFESAAR